MEATLVLITKKKSHPLVYIKSHVLSLKKEKSHFNDNFVAMDTWQTKSPRSYTPHADRPGKTVEQTSPGSRWEIYLIQQRLSPTLAGS